MDSSSYVAAGTDWGPRLRGDGDWGTSVIIGIAQPLTPPTPKPRVR